MTIPAELEERLADRFGAVESTSPVGGGCVSHAMRVDTAARPVFVKYERQGPTGFFAAERRGLMAMARAAPEHLRIPEVHDVEDSSGGLSWIVTEWIETAGSAPGFPAQLGRGLAEMHRETSERWGWETDGYIGRLPQSNQPTGRWDDFWWNRRIEPQLDLAARRMDRNADWSDLRERLPDLLAPAAEDGPSLIHGDLWNGNVLSGRDGPVLIDPAAYNGHREVDLAMADLFGGFDRTFFEAYDEAWPLQPGYQIRRSIYQLYYLLVHVNLFGASYIPRTTSTLRSILSSRGVN